MLKKFIMGIIHAQLKEQVYQHIVNDEEIQVKRSTVAKEKEEQQRIKDEEIRLKEEALAIEKECGICMEECLEFKHCTNSKCTFKICENCYVEWTKTSGCCPNCSTEIAQKIPVNPPQLHSEKKQDVYQPEHESDHYDSDDDYVQPAPPDKPYVPRVDPRFTKEALEKAEQEHMFYLEMGFCPFDGCWYRTQEFHINLFGHPDH